MDHERFRDWFSRVDDLTAAQREEVAAALSGRPQGAASLATIELGVDEERRLCALRHRRFCLSGQGARSALLSVQGLREDIQRAHRHGAVGSAPQGALAVVRRVGYPPAAAALTIPHESINRSAGERVRGAPCTSRPSTAATARSRGFCEPSAASPPSTLTAISGGSISSNSATGHPRVRVSRRRWPDHAYESRIEPFLS